VKTGELIERWVKPGVRQLHPYHVPSRPDLVKLDAMESPFTLSSQMQNEWSDILKTVEVNRYPDAGSQELKSSLREKLNIPGSCEILLGNGSDELIQLIAILLGGAGKTIMAPMPSFSMYQQICIATGTNFYGINLNKNFSLDREQTISAIRKHQPACIFLAYPNNPTGNCFASETISQILDEAPGLVILDEAYFEFCGKSYIDEIIKYPNLIVLRTLSKSGFAGLRLGLMIANADWINEFEKIRLPYNINCLTQASANFFLGHFEIFRAQSKQICENRSALLRQLDALAEIKPYPSETNFILCRTKMDGNQAFASLKANGVLVRNLHSMGASLENCIRVTVSTEQENNKFIQAVKNL